MFVADAVLPGGGYLGVYGSWKGCHVKVTIFNVYGPQEAAAKRVLWSNLLRIRAENDSPWCLMGDFNAVRQPGERKGSTFNGRIALDFNEFINFSQLLEVGMGIKKYTWIDRGGSKLRKLDRFLISRELLDIWPGFYATILDRCFSNSS